MRRDQTLKETLAVILAGGQGERLWPLTMDRAKPAVPFAGIYRIIDFTLSNVVNSGLRRIFVLTQYKSASLERHLKIGWNIFSSALGEYVFTIPPQLRVGEYWYRGTADAIYQNLFSFDAEEPKRLLVLSGDHLYKMDYSDMIEFHKESGASVTVASIPIPVEEANRFGVLVVDEESRIVDFQEKPKENPKTLPGDPTQCLGNMGVYLFEYDVLRRVVTEEAERAKRGEPTSHDFGKDILPRCIDSERIFAFPFKSPDGESTYWRDIGTLDSYYAASMDLVSVKPELNLYDRSWVVRSRPMGLPPAKFVFGAETLGRMGVAVDSIVAAGTIVSGGKVEQSVLGFRVRVNSFSNVSESILMDGVEVGRHAKIKRAIVDKRVVIPAGCEIGFDREADARRFHLSPEGIVVIPKGTVIPES